MATATFLLVEERIGEDVNELIRRMRIEGTSFDQIARTLTERAGFLVTYETVRRWAKTAEQSHDDTEAAS